LRIGAKITLRDGEFPRSIVFREFAGALDTPERYSAVYDVRDVDGDGAAELVHEKLRTDAVWCTWVSDKNVDVQTLREFSGARPVMLSVLENVRFVNIPDGCKLETIDVSSLYIRTSEAPVPPVADCSGVAELTARHLPLLSKWRADEEARDCAEQYERIIRWRAEDDAAGAVIYGLVENGTLVSGLAVSETFSQKPGKTQKEINTLYTLPESRNRGCAKRLVAAAISRSDCADFLYGVRSAPGQKNTASEAVAVFCGFRRFAGKKLCRIG
jgi:GNAT superfamily N-acetyltransferase